ncbi:uncharacterized protein LOC116601227 [Nematostella vectensis]|uniref:uncharacterized protein LOC116601227 n=1 Tax=Nematostella vectensis TaxID=45351 RepID=UPI0020770A96|nr:uncharacterized protein LOC116601227 [Nematostella vectensis]
MFLLRTLLLVSEKAHKNEILSDSESLSDSAEYSADRIQPSSICESDEGHLSKVSDDSTEEYSTRFAPYEEEPLARPGTIEDEEENVDLDGLTPQHLAEREDGIVQLEQWGKCEGCRTERLEHRCCREIKNIEAKLVGDGSIDRIKCICKQEDFTSMTNVAVLKIVAPLLKGKNGQSYRRRPCASENEFLRAVAYRWIARWFLVTWVGTTPVLHRPVSIKTLDPDSTQGTNKQEALGAPRSVSPIYCFQDCVDFSCIFECYEELEGQEVEYK